MPIPPSTLPPDGHDHDLPAPSDDYRLRQTSHLAHGASPNPDRVLAEAEQAGIDVVGLKRNLELSPDERLDQFLKALAWLEWARQAMRQEAV